MELIRIFVYSKDTDGAGHPCIGTAEITPEIQSQILAPLVARLEALERAAHVPPEALAVFRKVFKIEAPAPVDAGPATIHCGNLTSADIGPAKPVDAGPACYMRGEPRSAHKPGADGRPKCPPITMPDTPPADDAFTLTTNDTQRPLKAILTVRADGTVFVSGDASAAEYANALGMAGQQIAALRQERDQLKALLREAQSMFCDAAHNAESLQLLGRMTAALDGMSP